ncbi:hypothetical protein TorRG33x02_070510 [Trema orientale]|uniref:Uncharacterized protein n=1 Tax=Trema orientale TaxID=63057 RepID=A0A2P5FHL1_TREOI|nr:hypothetical protein TorRG33x02_070510 [Trema orientale]
MRTINFDILNISIFLGPATFPENKCNIWPRVALSSPKVFHCQIKEANRESNLQDAPTCNEYNKADLVAFVQGPYTTKPKQDLQGKLKIKYFSMKLLPHQTYHSEAL